LNLRPSGYEPDELPGCSTPRQVEPEFTLRSSTVKCFVKLVRRLVETRFRASHSQRCRAILAQVPVNRVREVSLISATAHTLTPALASLCTRKQSLLVSATAHAQTPPWPVVARGVASRLSDRAHADACVAVCVREKSLVASATAHALTRAWPVCARGVAPRLSRRARAGARVGRFLSFDRPFAREHCSSCRDAVDL
jgi:hypothetical protein